MFPIADHRPQRIIGNGYSRPGWKYDIQRDKGKKHSGQWNRRSSISKHDTRNGLMRDIRFCMRENIPFKTNSLEYNPRDQWVYVKGVRTLHYDMYEKRLVEFTYSGVYNKVTSLFLRMFGISVKLVARKLQWKIQLGPRRDETSIREIDIHGTYSLDNSVTSSNYPFHIR